MSDTMSNNAYWNHEQPGQTESVEALIRRAHTVLAEAGVTVSPSKVSRRVRACVRKYSIDSAERMIANYAAITSERGSFDAYCLTYADPTGESAVRNLVASR